MRGRQKALRRRTLLRCAEHLFARDGIDGTTMAAIAQAADVSPPTVFNYFGSKDNLLSALIFEGTQEARSDSFEAFLATDRPFATVITALLCGVTDRTMEIAGKRIWRYAEAASIRRAGSEFQTQFHEVDTALRDLIVEFLDAYAIVLRSGAPPDTTFLANLIFDRWSARYLEYIKDDDMSRKTHQEFLRDDALALVDLLFAPEFAAHAPLKTRTAAQ